MCILNKYKRSTAKDLKQEKIFLKNTINTVLDVITGEKTTIELTSSFF
jgi:hypothetical protein